MPETSLTIGRLARRASVNVETIRYYQKLGLIQEPRRPASGYRHYPPDTINRVGFIKRAQQLGFTLGEIGALLKLGDGRCRETRALAAQKLGTINDRIRDLEAMRAVLTDLIRACQARPEHKGCPIVSALTRD